MTLLSRLVQFAADSGMQVPPPYYKSQRVQWVLAIHPDGSLASPELQPLASPDDPTRRYGVEHMVPSITKTSGVAPRVAVDSPSYLFGWVPENGKADRTSREHQAFRELTADWLKADPSGPARSLHRFLSEGHLRNLVQPDSWKKADQVIVRVQGTSGFLHGTPSAQRYWASVATARKGSGETGLCLVCGTVGELLQTIPQQLPARLVPQASQSASLVSVNKATHGFGLQEQLVHTPICSQCGLAAMHALEALLDGQWQSALAGQDTRLAWWVTGPGTGDFTLDPLDDPRPQPTQVAHMLGSAARGQAIEAESHELEMFCSVAIGGNVSRIIIREWIDMPLVYIQQNLSSWFADHQIVDVWEGERRYVGIGRMTHVTGRWLPDRNQYAKPGASGEDRPPATYQALLRAALLRKPLPPKLLAHIIRRIRADGRLDAERAALIRLALVRRPGIQHPERYMPVLNPENSQPAYLSGRIFAVLEDIQHSAAWAAGDDAPNVTFTDRYFARAVTSPAVALVAGRRDARAWLKKLRRDRPKVAAFAEQRLDELFARLAEAGGVPHGAVLADQAAFILGYHQQRAATRASRAASKAQSTSEGEAA